MSRKQVVGITLTAEEKRMAGYERTPGRHSWPDAAHRSSRRDPITSHDCQVTLPDGSTCRASYTRYASNAHAFYFSSPLGERVYGQGSFASREAIEERAQQVVGICCRWARRWQEPRFLADVAESVALSAGSEYDADTEAEDEDDEEEDPEDREA